MPLLPDSIRYSETLEASPAELIEAVREHWFEGIVAKRRDSLYEPGKRSGAWRKMRVHQKRDLVIGGYTPAGRTFDAILIGNYQGPRFSTSRTCAPGSRRRCARLSSSNSLGSKRKAARSRTCPRRGAAGGAKD
jgi:bifunctional non-homologous end joining protein LigD